MTDDSNTPRADRLSEEIQDMLREFFQCLCAFLQQNRSSVCDVQKLREIDIQVTSNTSAAWAQALRLENDFNATCHKLGKDGEEKFEALRIKLCKVPTYTSLRIIKSSLTAIM